jgi:hypothetical protein
MKKKIYLLLALSTVFVMAGCGENESDEGSSSTATVVQGWHNQGKDCLACHNVDLQDERHLLFAGTVYKTENVTDTEDLNNVCGGELNVNFWDASRTNLIFASKDYVDPNSKGNRGKGNIFILQRLLSNIAPNNYYIEITDANSTVLTSYLHQFSGQDYDINNPENMSNRVSCNACHTKNGVQYPIYVDSDKKYLCQ